jgi:DNA-binding NarL/FixJ family response regulator
MTQTPQPTTHIRVLLVDDQANVRRGLRMRLGLEPDFEIVGEAADGESALHMARLLAPNVVVMDVRMPNMDGIAATTAIHADVHTGMHATLSHPAVVLLSLYDDEQTRARATAAGADAFVPKDCLTECLSDAIRTAVAAHPLAHTGS